MELMGAVVLAFLIPQETTEEEKLYKRTVTSIPDRWNMGNPSAIREIYTDFKLDEKIDPSKFELTQDKK